MGTLTMVASKGVLNGKKPTYTGFMIVDDSYNVRSVSVREVQELLSRNPGAIANMELVNGIPTSSNGAMERYAFVDESSGQYMNTNSSVILDRITKDGKAIGYTLYCPDGIIRRLPTEQVVQMAANKLICNGKVGKDDSGVPFVSSIRGTYTQVVVKDEDKQETDTTPVSLMVLFATQCPNLKGFKDKAYVGAIVSCSNMAKASKIVEACYKDNKKLQGELIDYAGDKIRTELKIVPLKPGVYYVVVSTEMFGKIVDMPNAKVTFPRGLSISLIEYTQPHSRDFLYAEVKLGQNLEIVADSLTSDSDNMTAALQTFAKDIRAKMQAAASK